MTAFDKDVLRNYGKCEDKVTCWLWSSLRWTHCLHDV